MSTLTLRPNAGGDETTLYRTGGASPDSNLNYAEVDEVNADGDTTYVFGNNYHVWKRDLYNIPNHTTETGTINKITVFLCCHDRTGDGYKASIKAGTTVSDSSEVTIGGTHNYVLFSKEWALNPADNQAWEWADIDGLQIGVSCYQDGDPNVTQVYVEVDYTVITTYELSCSDTFKSGDTSLTQRTLYLSLIDGLKSGDATGNIAKFFPSLLDSAKLGDATLAQHIRYLTLLDSAKLGDTTTLQFAYYLTLADSIKLGDTTLIQYTRYLSLIDGIKLADITTLQLTLYLALTDGIKMGDTTLAAKIFNLLLTEGVKISDILSFDILYTFMVGDKKIDEHTEKQLLEFGAKMASETGNKTIDELIHKFIGKYRS